MASLQDEFQSENDGAPNGKLPAGIYAMRIWNEAERFGWIGKGKKVHIGNMIYIYTRILRYCLLSNFSCGVVYGELDIDRQIQLK